MYSYQWNEKTGGYALTTQKGKYVASELRPVFAEELLLLGFDEHFKFDHTERNPLMWAKRNLYMYRGEVVAKLEKTRYGQPLNKDYLGKPSRELTPVDVETMVKENTDLMDALIGNTLKRIKEMYDESMSRCDIAYIGFSGGKDSVVLLDLCHRALPLSVPVIFSDTDMELPDTYKVWEEIKHRYPGRKFYKAKADSSALENWKTFGPPSQTLRWCCSVHKSTPAVLLIKKLTDNCAAKTIAFLGVRKDESMKRSNYGNDIGIGVKNSNQINAMPIIDWGAHEIFLYIFSFDLLLNNAYRNGIPRVGCIMCPMSSEKQVYLISQLYPSLVSEYASVIKSSFSREFKNIHDQNNFVFMGGWQARQSGVNLKSVISPPSKNAEKGKINYSFKSNDVRKIIEWLKTLGKLVKVEELHYILMIAEKHRLEIVIYEGDVSSELSVSSDNGHIPKYIQKYLRFVVQKGVSCVHCRTCEAECPFGAISFSPKFSIDQSRCNHCLKCHSSQEGCIRYFSKRYAGGTSMNISGINKYMTFGLKQEWLAVLASERENFRSTKSLGNRQIPSAITWFREAGLISENTAVTPTPLFEYAERKGFDNYTLWHLIWFRLATYSPLIKWYVCNTQFEERILQEDLHDLLQKSVSSESVRKGAITSLCAIFKNSPLGTGDSPLVEIETKGSRVLSLTRKARNVDSLVILYGLFVMAGKANNSEFTISQMMTSDFNAKFVSPLVAFGMSVADFKAVCQGLANKYPDFINCSFTHGLEDVRVKTEDKTTGDVVELMLK